MSDDPRSRNRAMKIVNASALIRQRVGRLSLEESHIATLSTISEMKGLWQCLIDRGLLTEEQRQTYLDRGADQLLAQVEGMASKIMVTEIGNG